MSPNSWVITRLKTGKALDNVIAKDEIEAKAAEFGLHAANVERDTFLAGS